ncbi:MAG: amphi-Trp domain-containing protein [Candidatus Promineifilaceae bacterium]|nr:amphi-Trp domain-containing protein [Candidatus Promineifilaceae bacterium]
MGKETVLFKSEEHQDRQAVAEFLRDLADRVADGQVNLRQGEQAVSLEIPYQVVLELKAEVEDKGRTKKRSLEVEIEWTDGGQASGPVVLG